MSFRPVAPSPVAGILLDAADRMADGAMWLGGRRVVVRRGRIAGVSSAPGDTGLDAYLAAAGALESPAPAEADGGDERARWAALREHVPAKALEQAVRRLWAERIARGIASAEADAEADTPPYFEAGPPQWDGGAEVALTPLILEALVRLAHRGDAEAVGSHAGHLFAWDLGPHRDTAAAWLELPPESPPTPVTSILAADPAAAPRIAAVLRAGLAHLVAPGSALPAPPARPATLPPPASARPARPPSLRPPSLRPTSGPPPDDAVTEGVAIPRAPRMPGAPTGTAQESSTEQGRSRTVRPSAAVAGGSTIPPPRAAAMSLSPGRGAPAEVAGSLPPLTLTHTPLRDPIEPVEQLIAQLEHARAPGPERAAAWREAARLFDTRMGSLAEAARAFREAAAADPEDRVAQREAALRCAALGQFTVARAYAEAGVELARTDKERAAALKRVAQLALWEMDVDGCVRALESALEADPADVSLHQRLWAVFIADGRMEEAVRQACAAAARFHAVEPARARAMLAWAHACAPDDLDIATEYALAIGYDGYREGSVALLARALGRLAGPAESAAALWTRAQAALGEVRPAPGTPSRRRTLPEERRTEAQARALEAFDHERQGRAPEAVRAAEAAREADPDSALATLVLFDLRDQLDETGAGIVVLGVRRVIGDTLAVVSELAHRARRTGDVALLREVIEARFQIAPQDAASALARLQFHLEHGDAQSLRGALRDALNVDRFDHAEAAREALLRLRALGDDMMDIGLRAVERLGHRDRSLCTLLVEASATDARPHLRVLAFEHAFARAEEADRPKLLLDLAAHFSGRGMIAEEARTLVRVLAVAPYHPQALERLSEVYAEAGEAERLMAVLSLRLEASPHPDERAQRLRDLAAAALHLAGDRKRALGFVQAIIDEAGDDPVRVAFGIRALVALHKPRDVVVLLSEQALARDPRGAAPLWVHAVAIAETEAEDRALALATATRGLGHTPQSAPLLLAFERLALDARDVEGARAVYRSLMDRAMGVHGRRALAYREARWLERAGDGRAALDAYAQAFGLAPGAGVVFGAMERLATSLGEFEPLVAALETLGALSTDADQRRDYVLRAAALCEGELDSPRRAFELLVAGWRDTGQARLKEQAHRLARVIAARSSSEGAEAYAAYLEVLRLRADRAWDHEDKVATLREIAKVYAFDCEAPDLAAAVLDEAVEVAGKAEDLAEARADMLADAAEWLLTRPGATDEAAARVRRALALAPGHPRARSLAANVGIEEPPATSDSKRPSFIPAPGPSGGEDAAVATLRERVSAGDLDAGVELADLLTERGHAREAHHVLLAVVRREPDRTPALRRLYALSQSVPVPAVAAVTGEILALFNPALGARAARVHFPDAVFETSHDVHLARPARVLRLAWEHTARVYCVERSDLGLVGTDVVAPLGKSHLATAYADTLRRLQLSDTIKLYTRKSENHTVFPVATRPPIVLVDVRSGRDDLEDLDALRFRIARAAELARPEHILLVEGPTPAHEAIRLRLLEAIELAFGRTAGTQAAASADPACAALAEELWRLFPGPAQAEASTILATLEDPLDPAHLAGEIRARAACVGLAVAGRIAPAVRGLAADDPSLRGITIASESEYAHACAMSAPLRAMIRFALCDTYLAAHALSAAFTP